MILRDSDCHKVHHGAHRGSFAQVSVNYEPDIARERRRVFTDADEIVVSIADEAGQARHTDPGPHGDQVFVDVVEFTSHRAIAGNPEQPPLLRHVGKVLIEGDELPPVRRAQMSKGPAKF